MKKKVKKWGKGLGIYIDKEDAEIFRVKEGDIIEISDIIVIKSKRRKK